MVCGSATGQFLPPNVVYKAKYLYENWCEDGSPGMGYSCTSSGWFDMHVFYKWFRIFSSLLSRIPQERNF